jgi:hypothetical protein
MLHLLVRAPLGAIVFAVAFVRAPDAHSELSVGDVVNIRKQTDTPLQVVDGDVTRAPFTVLAHEQIRAAHFLYNEAHTIVSVTGEFSSLTSSCQFAHL